VSPWRQIICHESPLWWCRRDTTPASFLQNMVIAIQQIGVAIFYQVCILVLIWTIHAHVVGALLAHWELFPFLVIIRYCCWNKDLPPYAIWFLSLQPCGYSGKLCYPLLSWSQSTTPVWFDACSSEYFIVLVIIIEWVCFIWAGNKPAYTLPCALWWKQIYCGCLANADE